MMMMEIEFKEIPKYPRYNLVKKNVIDTLLKYSSNKIPISLQDIVKNFPNLNLQTYRWYENAMEVDRDYIISEVAKSEEGSLIDLSDAFGNEEYMILYNETDKLGRKRFTIAHEIGHYILEH